MDIEEIKEKINHSIYKDANKKMVVHGKVVEDIFIEKERLIEFLTNQIKTKEESCRIYDALIQKRIEELEKEHERDLVLLKEQNFKICKLKERVKLVLDSCDNNEKNHDYAIATDSVRAMLTDYPMKQLPNK